MKLTPEQKLANKDASLLKLAAYSARRAAMRLAEEEIKKHPDLVALSEAADATNKAESDLCDARNASIKALQLQIAEIEAKIADVRLTSNPLVDVASQKRRDAYGALSAKNEQLHQKVKAQFHDIEKSYGYCSNWVPPAGYIEAYAAEHAVEIAKKKAARNAAAKRRGAK